MKTKMTMTLLTHCSLCALTFTAQDARWAAGW